VTQQRCDGRQINVLHQAAGCVVAEPMRVDVGHIGATAKDSQ
jgi:hypothetical protein